MDAKRRDELDAKAPERFVMGTLVCLMMIILGSIAVLSFMAFS